MRSHKKTPLRSASPRMEAKPSSRFLFPSSLPSCLVLTGYLRRPVRDMAATVLGRLGSAFVGKGDLNLGVHFVDCQAEADNEKEALLPVGWGMRDVKCTVQNS